MYALRPPAASLARFIEHYWFVTPEGDAPVELRVDVFVDGRADLIFNFGAPYVRELLVPPKTRALHERSNLDAQRLVPIRIQQRGHVRIAGVRFRLGGLAPFVSGELRAFTGLTPPPSAVLGHDAEALEAALEGAVDIDAQAQHLDAFFSARLTLDDGHARFASILAALEASGGRARIEALAESAQVSSRHVDRLFARYLGIAPKSVARILRFQSTLLALMRDPGCTLADVAADAGYFDQAHFIKDFKRLSGGVPRGYRGYYPERGPADFAPNVVVFLQDGEGPST